jgi:GntR family transcriptional regulator of gluconate operon
MVLPLKRDNLRKRLARTLFGSIVKGEFKPGDRIVEGSLAAQLGVAQSSLREALQELEHQGLVTKYDNRGTFVTVIAEEEIDQLYAVRKQLEPFAASLVRERITPEDSEKLSELLEKMRQANDRRDLVELAHADLEFHEMIWHLSGNRWLERALRLVGPPLLALDYVGLYGAPTYDFERAYRQHESLLATLNSGSGERAKKIFEETLEVFRLQDIENLSALKSTQAPARRASHLKSAPAKRQKSRA